MKRGIYYFTIFLLIALIAFGNSVVADEDSDNSGSSDNSESSEDSNDKSEDRSGSSDDSSDESKNRDRDTAGNLVDSPDDSNPTGLIRTREEIKQRQEVLREETKNRLEQVKETSQQQREQIREESKDRMEDLIEERLELRRRFLNEDGKEVRIELKRELKDGREELRRKISIGDSEVETDLEVEEDTTRKDLRVRLSNGNNQEIKFMPDRASEVALRVLESRGFNLELREVGNEEKRAVYEARAEKAGRILGLFRAKAELSTRIDADTGEVLEVKRPWWLFLMNNAEEVTEETTEITDTVLAGEQPEVADEDLAAI